MTLPSKCKVGEIYCLLKSNNKKEYYICLKENKFQRIVTDDDINNLNINFNGLNFGNEINSEIGSNSENEILNLLSDLSREIEIKLNQIQEALTNTVTKEELNEYQQKIEYLSGLIFNYFL